VVPAGVDCRTGYRSYYRSQLIDAAIVKRLRQLDVPLAGFHTVLDARDPGVTGKIVGRHEARLNERLAETEHIVRELEESRGDPAIHRRYTSARWRRRPRRPCEGTWPRLPLPPSSTVPSARGGPPGDRRRGRRRAVPGRDP